MRREPDLIETLLTVALVAVVGALAWITFAEAL